MDVTIQALDASGSIIYAKTVTAVPFKRNRTTSLTGTLFSTSGTASFSVETDWVKEFSQYF